MNKVLLSEKLREKARAIGIDALGFTHAAEFTDYALQDSKRRNPKLSLPRARSIIVAGIYIGGITLPIWTDPDYGRTSRLYLSEYFLDVVKPLDGMVALLRKAGHQAIVCDSSSGDGSTLPLKLAAVRAGLGWQGKHSLLISPQFGSFLALGGIITDAELEYATREVPNRCGSCQRCRDVCPLQALDQPHVLKTERCLSYLLQCKELPREARAVMENRVGDCEICQEACPWNRAHMENPLVTAMTEGFRRRAKELERLFLLSRLTELSEQGYREELGYLNTTIPYAIFHRNAVLAREN